MKIPNRTELQQIAFNHSSDTRFFNKKSFDKTMSSKPQKTLRKCSGILQPQIPELQFLQMLIFPRVL